MKIFIIILLLVLISCQSPIISQTGNTGNNTTNNILGSQSSTIVNDSNSQSNNSNSGAKLNVTCPAPCPTSKVSLNIPTPSASPTTLTTPTPTPSSPPPSNMSLSSTISFGDAPIDTIKTLEIVGANGETDTVFLRSGQDIKTLRVRALNNLGQEVVHSGYIWRFSSLSPFPGYLKYPIAPSEVELTSQLTTGSVELIAESLDLGLSDHILLQVEGE